MSKGEKLVSASICGYVAEAFIRNDTQISVFSMKRSIKIFSTTQTLKKKDFAHSLLFLKFATILRHSGGLHRRALNKKVLLKLSSEIKFSQNL